jgi:hypothetical protein
MCRSIKTLRGIEPAVTEGDVRAAALQYVRKISGYRKPSRANQAAFDTAVEEITAASQKLLDGLTPSAVPAPRTVTAFRTIPSAESA